MVTSKNDSEQVTTSHRPLKSSVRGRKAVAKHPSKTRPGLPEPRMTYVEDRGTVYDAPLEVVWDFMENDEKFHPKAHTADVRNFESKALSEVTILLSYEARRGGQWLKRVCRMTTVRPAIRVQEDLIGPYAGSKTVFLYTPRGEQTVVDVLGYLQSSELTPSEIRRDRKKTWSKAYSEDLPYFRLFAKQHPSVLAERS